MLATNRMLLRSKRRQPGQAALFVFRYSLFGDDTGFAAMENKISMLHKDKKDDETQMTK
ncbi:hypothetical protein [Pollutibacter soli]|uniref:hypothetical protein n=1 Tax=Pollutibacter soli TaxID=3034157 RepID=UPI0030133A4E